MARTPNIDLREDYQRNYIINGNFDFWQRGTSLLVNDQTFYLADRFLASDSSPGSITVDRSTDVPDANSTYSLQATVTSTGTLTTTQTDLFGYRMEGYDLQQLAGKALTLTFKVKSSITGIYSIAFRNEASDRSYVAEYSINQANTWEEKKVTIEHDTTGTWNYTNGIGLRISWMLDSGPDFKTATLDQWQSGLFVASSNQTNFMNNSGATFKLSQIQLLQGAEALPFRRAGRNIGEEQDMCERYFQKTWATETPVGFNTTTGRLVIGCFQSGATIIGETTVELKKSMRALPTVITYSTSGLVPNVIAYTTRSSSSSVHPVYNIVRVTEGKFNIEASGVTGGARGDAAEIALHYTADAEL